MQHTDAMSSHLCTRFPNKDYRRRSLVISIATDTFCGSGHQHMPEEQWRRIRNDWMLAVPGHIVDKVAAKEFTAK